MKRIVTLSLNVLFAGLAASLSLPAAAQAWSLPIDGPAANVVETSYGSIVSAGDARFWALDTSGSQTALYYYANIASAPVAAGGTTARYVLGPTVTPQGELIAVLHDGTLVGRCRVVKYGTDGSLRWEQTYFDTACSFGVPVVRIWAAGNDTWWATLGSQLVRFGADGRLLYTTAADRLAGDVKAVDPRNGNLYTKLETPAGEFFVVAYDNEGRQRWRTEVESFDPITVAADGSLRIVGAKSGGWYVAALGSDGTARWSTTLDPVVVGEDPYALIAAPLVDANGATLVYSGPADAAIKIGADGRLAWRVGVTALGAATKGNVVNARLAPNGDLALWLDDRVARIQSNGAVRYAKAAPATIGSVVAFPAGDDILVLLGEVYPDPSRLVRYDLAGNELPALAGGGGVERATATRATLADGSIVVWTDAGSGTRELRRVKADGTTLWRQPTPGVWSRPANPGPAGGAIAANGDRVCALDTRKRDAVSDTVLSCHRLGDGSALWTRAVREGSRQIGFANAQLNVAADGTATAWYAFADGGSADDPRAIGYARVGADGTLLAGKVVTVFGTLAPVSPADSAYALVSGTLYNPDGSERYRLPALSGVADPYVAAIAADGSAVVAWNDTSFEPQKKDNLTRYDGSGRNAWSTKVDFGDGPAVPPVIGGDSVYVATQGDSTSRMTRYKLADGAVLWQRELGLPNTRAYKQLRHVALSGGLVFDVGSSGPTVDVNAYDVQDGSVRGRRRIACRTAECVAVAPQAAGDRINVLDAGRVASSLVSWQAPPAQNGLVRIDQAGLAGAWWAPYANGEGFVLDYLPASRTFFMPWFTFRRELTSDPSGLRWYVVQGTVPQNAKTVELPITQAIGGVFDAGPVVPGEIVGKVTLSFTDCSNGTLEYTFTGGVNSNATGLISLSRLSPATTPCTLADGTTQPGAGTRPATNGFDSRMSGSWYEEATSGQGLEFVIQPNGLYFATWFTFDPAGPSDDPERQRWLTLQGSLENARNGVVEAPIVQGVGGAFDRVPTNNVSLIGSSTLTMLGCDRAKLDYRFDDSSAAGALRKLTGTIDLIKIGGCSQ